jgi:hypothetical protein
MRRLAADTKVAATKVELIAPETVAASAAQLAAAASLLAIASEAATNLDMGVSVQAPDFTRLDECIAAFIRVAAAAERP